MHADMKNTCGEKDYDYIEKTIILLFMWNLKKINSYEFL
jgi:hypothetical protein